MKKRLIAMMVCVAVLCTMAVPLTVSAADVQLPSNAQTASIPAVVASINSTRAVHAWYYCNETVKVWSGKGTGTLYGYIYKGTTVDATSASGSYIYVVNGSLEGWALASSFTFLGYSY